MRAVVFSGTTEGRAFSKQLGALGADVLVSVATDLGAEEQGSAPGVAAVQERGVLTPGGVEQLQYFIRQVGGGTVFRAASRQGRQQPTGP